MHPNAIKKVAETLKDIKVTSSEIDSFPTRIHDGVGYCLSHESLIKFNEQVNSIPD
jgi:hypothetical protein